MKRQWYAIFVGVLCFVSSCGDESNGDASSDGVLLFDDNLSAAQIAALPLIGEAQVGDLGSYPSDLGMFGDYLYVVDYSNNAIHRVHADTLKVEKNDLDLGQNAAPYSVYADNSAVYVALQGAERTERIVRVSHDDQSKSVVLTSSECQAPTDVVTVNGYTIVADSEYDYADATKTGGAIIVVTPDQKKISHQTHAQNPVFLQVIDGNSQPLVLAVEAGVTQYDASFNPILPEKTCLEVWKLSELAQNTQAPSRVFCLPHEVLGRMTLTDTHVFFGNASHALVHSMALSDVRNAPSSDDAIQTIRLDENTDMTTTTPLWVNGVVSVLEFRNSRLIWDLDGEAQTFYLTQSEVAPKNPIDAVYDAERRRMYVLNSTSGSIDVLKIQ